MNNGYYYPPMQPMQPMSPMPPMQQQESAFGVVEMVGVAVVLGLLYYAYTQYSKGDVADVPVVPGSPPPSSCPPPVTCPPPKTCPTAPSCPPPVTCPVKLMPYKGAPAYILIAADDTSYVYANGVYKGLTTDWKYAKKIDLGILRSGEMVNILNQNWAKNAMVKFVIVWGTGSEQVIIKSGDPGITVYNYGDTNVVEGTIPDMADVWTSTIDANSGASEFDLYKNSGAKYLWTKSGYQNNLVFIPMPQQP